MKLPKEDLEEVREGKVLRLAVPELVAPGTKQPHPALFTLSKKDVHEALEVGRPPMLSVFDRKRTSVAQAWEIFGREVGGLTFELEIDTVTALTVHLSDKAPPIRVLRDLRLRPKLVQLPGSEGHCGIAGLHREPGLERQPYKNVRAALCDIAQLVVETS